MRAHNITLIMACLFTIAACAAYRLGVHPILLAFIAADAIASLALSALYAPVKES